MKFLDLYHSCLKLLFSYITKIQFHQNIKIKPNINNSTVFVKIVSKIILVNVNEKYILCSHVNDRSKTNYYYIYFLMGGGLQVFGSLLIEMLISHVNMIRYV